ncbi:MAG: endonuclease III [Kiritimatiellaeota bacterium]|nr:endonuclease III [Kiritimatiellota bacterium]
MKSSRWTAKLLLETKSKLFERYGPQECPLRHESPFQLLVAVILSAQCTDKKVNTVTPILFERYPDFASLAEADSVVVEKDLRPLGLFRAKTASVIGSAREIASRFQGEVPKTLEELVSLPGVGRKTANVILGNAFGKPGFPVDTHVIRLLNRIGVVDTKTPEKIEKVVNENLPPEHWTDFSHLLITHGRQCCKASKPDCANCDLRCAARNTNC